MRPIRQGDRGPAVEDIQRRLLALGHDLCPTGVDGVFLGATLAAVRSFQQGRRLAEDGLVGPDTWAALVDATFALGDRLLYLRLPYFHGHDVRVLQGALNALGFACGEPDGIFGQFTERAVREFQENTGQPVDGIAGAETVRAIRNLRHVWADKDPTAPVALKLRPARAAQALTQARIALLYDGELGREIADRVANLAVAAQPDARIAVQATDSPPGVEVDLVLALVSSASAPPSGPVVRLDDGSEASLAARLVTAVESGLGTQRKVTVDLRAVSGDDERFLQRTAVCLLDAVCAALADIEPSVLS
jgi:lysozyme family protein